MSARRRKKRKNDDFQSRHIKRLKKELTVTVIHKGIENIHYKHKLVATIYWQTDGYICDIAISLGANLEYFINYTEVLDFIAFEINWFNLSRIKIDFAEERINLKSELDSITILFSDGDVCISGGLEDDWQLAFNSWNEAVHFAATILSPIPRACGLSEIPSID